MLPTWWQRSCCGIRRLLAARRPDPDLSCLQHRLYVDPVVDWLAAWHVPCPAGIALVLGGTLGTLALFLVLVLPSIATDVAGVIQELPTQLARLWTTTAPWLEQRGIAIPHTTTEWVERLNALASEVAR